MVPNGYPEEHHSSYAMFVRDVIFFSSWPLYIPLIFQTRVKTSSTFIYNTNYIVFAVKFSEKMEI